MLGSSDHITAGVLSGVGLNPGGQVVVAKDVEQRHSVLL